MLFNSRRAGGLACSRKAKLTILSDKIFFSGAGTRPTCPGVLRSSPPAAGSFSLTRSSHIARFRHIARTWTRQVLGG